MSDIYTHNKKEYSGIIENVAKNIAAWRLCTMVALLIAASAVGGLIYIGTQVKIRPLLVVMDADHQPVGIYQPGTGVAINDERVTKASLAQFIDIWRVVSIDGNYQRQRVNKLEMFINHNSPAFVKIKDYIVSPLTNPLRRGTTETASIRITNVLPISEQTWQIDWSETITQRNTGQSVTSRYQATVTFTFMEDVPADIMLTNPTGLLISDIHWSESIQ